jgi:hypothetical protein
VLKVVAYDAHGSVIRSRGAKARWEGPLPQHFHGDHWMDQGFLAQRIPCVTKCEPGEETPRKLVRS